MQSPPYPIAARKLQAFRWGWAAFMVAVTSVPYLWNYFSTPSGYHYTWILPPYPEDSFAYQAWAQQAAHGNLLFQIKYTALPQTAFLFHPFFLIAGWISALLGCDVGIVLWGLKAIGVALFFATFFRYVDYLGLDGFQSIVASILVGISSGLGGLLAFCDMAGQTAASCPADLWLVDMNTFFSLQWNPLFPYSLTLMLLAVYWLDRGTRDARQTDFWLSGLATGMLALIHPYSQPLLFAYAVIITVWRRRAGAPAYLWRHFLVLLPFLLYVAWALALHPLVSRHSAAGVMNSPPLVAYLLGFGFPLLLAAAGLAMKRGQLLKHYWHVILWFVLSVAFAYLPVWFQEKLIFGAHVPLCIVAGIAFDWFLAGFSNARARKEALIAAVVIFLPLLASTPIYLVAAQNAEVRENAGGAYFVSNEVMAGMKFLREKSKPDEVVFATPATSRLIPAFSGNTVLWGHWAMSVDAKERTKWFEDLFNEHVNWDDARRGREFWGTGIRYLFADGGLKQAMEQKPETWRVILNEADKVFANDSVVIYRHRGK
jgi:hypothetical protein